MRREKLLRKAISECKDYPTLPESVRNTCKKHDLKLAWLDKPISWLPYQVTAISDRYVTKTLDNASLKSDCKKDGKRGSHRRGTSDCVQFKRRRAHLQTERTKYTKSEAICDEIEKCIVQTGGTLRSL